MEGKGEGFEIYGIKEMTQMKEKKKSIWGILLLSDRLKDYMLLGSYGSQTDTVIKMNGASFIKFVKVDSVIQPCSLLY